VLSDDNGGHVGLTEDDVFYFGNLPGDANGDGVLDAADYIALKWAFGSSVSLTNASIDFDCSGMVDYGDLLVLMGSFGQRSISAPALPARAASVAPSTTGGAPDIVAEPAVAVAEPEPSAPSVDEPAVVGGILTPAELVQTGATESTESPMTTASPATTDAVAEAELLPAPVADAPDADVLAIAASVLGNRLVASSRGLPPAFARPANSLPPVQTAVRVGPLSIASLSTSPLSTSALFSPGRAGQVVADVLQQAGPWWPGDLAGRELPDEPWMTRLAVDIAGKPRKGRLDPIGLDVLAVSR